MCLRKQFANYFYASISMTYARVRGKLGDLVNGLQGHANVFAPTIGIKVMSQDNGESGNEFLDMVRWWSGVEFGPYITNLSVSLGAASGHLTNTDFGFNIGAGVDYFFHKHWGAGLQVKMHYVNFSPDDYIFFSFGPQLMTRF